MSAHRGGEAYLDLRVTPRAAADRIGPVHDGVLEVRVTRPPNSGEANRAVIGLVAGELGVARSRLSMVAGERGRRKRLRVEGVEQADLALWLAAHRPD